MPASQAPAPAEPGATFRTQKTGALLAYLAYYLHGNHLREVLIEVLWPEAGLDSGRQKLNVALSALRQQVEPPGVPDRSVLNTGRLTASLNPTAVTTDVAEFEAALACARQAEGEKERARWLAAAVELYGGDLLPGYYEDWVLLERQRLAEGFLQALLQLATCLEESGDLRGALDTARRAARADPLREETVREVMRLCAASGETAAALRHYRDLERSLRAHLGLQPSPATRALARELGGGKIESLDRVGGNEGAGTTLSAPQAAATPTTSAPCAPRDPIARQLPEASTPFLEPVGGAVPLDSPLYVVRSTDGQFQAAIARRDSVVLVKGARQVGKTSLLARGLQQAREAGARVVLAHFGTLNAAHLRSAETLLRALAEEFADQLELEVTPDRDWNARRGPSANFTRYLGRHILGRTQTALVWGLDDLDRLFSCRFGSEILALFRSWHNERALDPEGQWSRLTLAIAYATEAHLFITDLNQSPFNVGTRLTLDDFGLEQVADLNRRLGQPLADDSDLSRFCQLVGGHPYLVRRGLHELALRGRESSRGGNEGVPAQRVDEGAGLAEFEARAADADWIYGDHLGRLLSLLIRDPRLCETVQAVLGGRACPTEEAFLRLRTAGVLSGPSHHAARLRCGLYAAYLERRLSG